LPTPARIEAVNCGKEELMKRTGKARGKLEEIVLPS